MASLLQAAAPAAPGLGDILAGRDTISAGWDALIARCAGGDGLLPGGAADIPGATAHAAPGVPNASLPRALDLSALGLPAYDVVLYVTGPFTPAWPDKSLPTIDLTTAGLAATAFDVTAVSAGAATIFHVRLPSRSDCPGTDAPSRAQAQSDRLARVVTAASPRRVLLVAHGAAGGAARLVAGSGAPVVALVLLGAPAATVPLDVLDAPPAADALALLQSLLPAPPASGSEPPDLVTARAVLGLFAELYASPTDPNADLAPPAGIATLSIPVVSVRGALDAPTLTRAIGAVVQAALSGFADGPSAAAPTALGLGLRASATYPAATSAADASGVSFDIGCTARALGLPLAAAAPSPAAAISVSIDIYRAGGWLSGGPREPARAPASAAHRHCGAPSSIWTCPSPAPACPVRPGSSSSTGAPSARPSPRGP